MTDHLKYKVVYLAISIAMIISTVAHAVPPYSGTIFLDRDIITPSDPSTFQNITYTGRGNRQVFDRRVDNWITINAYLFDITFDDGLRCEAQVNPEFGSTDAALAEANKYAIAVGQLPTQLRRDVDELWIHKGVEPFGGGNSSILIHTGQSALYEADGILEETLVHEASHTSLDADHASSAGWVAAQNADNEFISTYARDNPQIEDIAETFLLYLAITYRADRISDSLYNTVIQTVPNRINYFDNQQFNMYPITSGNVIIKAKLLQPTPGSTYSSSSVTFQWDRPIDATYFDLIIGTNGEGSDNIRATAPVDQTELTVTGLPTDGTPINVRLWTYINGSWNYDDYTYDYSEPVVNPPIEGCFIATAAYGSYEHSHLHILRNFRDEVLLSFTAGNWFVKQYYKYSPSLANWIAKHPVAKAVTRLCLWPFIGLAWFMTAPISHQLIVIIGLGLLIAIGKSIVTYHQRHQQLDT